MNGTPLFEAFLNGQQERPPPVLLVIGGFAARVSQLTPDAMWGDPMLLARCVEDSHALTGGPPLCAGFDLTLLAEALGCSLQQSADGTYQVAGMGEGALLDAAPADLVVRGRLPVLLEAWDRLKVTVSGVSRIGVVPGVATVTAQLVQVGVPRETAASRAGSAARALARALLERGVHHILLAEKTLPRDGTNGFEDDYRSIANVVHFFRGKLFLLAGEAPSGAGRVLPVDVCLGAAVEGAGDRLCGGGIPTAALAQGRLPREEARAWLAGQRRRFLATDWEVPAETPPEIMLDIPRLAEEVTASL